MKPVTRSVLDTGFGMMVILLLAMMINQPAFSSDSIVGWASEGVKLESSTGSMSSTTTYPIFYHPQKGRYLDINGKIYRDCGDGRYREDEPADVPAKNGRSDNETGATHYRHKKYKGKAYHEKMKQQDDALNSTMTPSQKIYRDIKKRTNPEIFK
jgi:hypothetical protein